MGVVPMRHSSVSSFFLSPRLGSAHEIGILPGISLVYPGNSALRRRRRRRCRPLPPLSPTAAAAAVGCCHCRLRPLPPPFTAASFNHRHLRRPLPMSPLVAVASGRSRHRPPWSTWGPCGHLGQWRRLWGPGQSRPSLPQSLRCNPEPPAMTGQPSLQRSAWGGGSTTSCRS